jgi:hypothetical protein
VTFEGRLYVADPGLTDPVTGSAWGKNFVRLTGPNSLVWSMDRFSVKGRLKSGPAQFRSTATDGRGGSAVGTVTVTVNAAPVALADAATTIVGVPVTISVLANDTDANGNVLTVTAATQSPNGTASIVTTGAQANKAVLFSPNDLQLHDLRWSRGQRHGQRVGHGQRCGHGHAG